MAKLSYQARKRLPSSAFVFPGKRAYPIMDKSHAKNALARASANATPSEKAKIKAAVHKKYPRMGKYRMMSK